MGMPFAEALMHLNGNLAILWTKKQKEPLTAAEQQQLEEILDTITEMYWQAAKYTLKQALDRPIELEG